MKVKKNYIDLNKIPNFYQNYIFKYSNKLEENFNQNILSIILFGSIERGKWSKNSDIDLLLIFSNEILDISPIDEKISDLTIEFYENNELKDEKGNQIFSSIQELALSLMELSNFKTLFYDIAMDGIIIYDKDDVGLKFIKKIRHRIKKKGLKRIYLSDNDFYWKRGKIRFGEIVEL